MEVKAKYIGSDSGPGYVKDNSYILDMQIIAIRLPYEKFTGDMIKIASLNFDGPLPIMYNTLNGFLKNWEVL